MNKNKFAIIALLLPLFSYSDQWTQKADFGGGARCGSVGFSIGTKGYIGTGLHRDFWEYDPATDSWTQKADYGGGPRSWAIGFSIGLKGYIGTGSNQVDFWEYDPSTNIWIQKANYPGLPLKVGVGFSIGSKGYIGTGMDMGIGNSFYEYDQPTDTWIQKANYGGGGREGATGFSIGSKGYIGTGYSDTANSATSDFWEYNPTFDIWTQKASVGGGPRENAIAFSIGSKGYIGTGDDGNTGQHTADLWVYDTLLNTWTQSPLSGGCLSVFWAAAFTIGSKAYIGTGEVAAGPIPVYTASFWEYCPDSMNCATGITEALNSKLLISIYPNPSRGIIHLSSNMSEEKNIFVYDLMGKEIYSKQNLVGLTLEIDLSPTPKGICFLKVSSAKGSTTSKVILY